MHTFNLDDDIGNLAAQIPAVACVCLEHGIDFCCTGRRSAACALRDHYLDEAQILRDINAFPEFQLPDAPADNSSTTTAAFIIHRYFRPLGRRLSAIEALLHKIVYFHGEEQGRGFRRLKRAFAEFSSRRWDCAREKEEALYPAVLSPDRRRREVGLLALTRHRRIMKGILEEMSALRSRLSFTEGSCASVRALDTSLTALLQDCEREMRLERRFYEGRLSV